MKRITCLALFSIYLFNCGGGRAVQDVSPQEEQIARSLVVQEGERPKIAPDKLKPKVPPQKIISSTQTAPTVAAPKEIKKSVEAPKLVEKDTVTVVVAEEKNVPKDTLTIVSASPATVVGESKEVVTPVADIVKETEAPETPAVSEPFELQNIAFDDIYFDDKSQLPSSTFNSNYYVTLGKIVKALRNDPEIKVRISGYTDFEGSEQYNYDLSEKRAKTFAKILLDLFPADVQADIAQRIEINPRGSSDLLVESQNKARRALNRRVSFELFYGDLKNNPYSVYIHPGAPAPAAVRPTTASAVVSSSASSHSMQQKLYDKAMMLFNQKRYNEAIDIFDEIIAIDAKHSLVDNAYFWIGEALYYQGRYSEALEKYRQVFTSGDGNKSAAAQMRLGYCFFRLNQLDQAAVEFQKVISNYPNASEEIRRSKMVLSKIKNY